MYGSLGWVINFAAYSAALQITGDVTSYQHAAAGALSGIPWALLVNPFELVKCIAQVFLADIAVRHVYLSLSPPALCLSRPALSLSPPVLSLSPPALSLSPPADPCVQNERKSTTDVWKEWRSSHSFSMCRALPVTLVRDVIGVGAWFGVYHAAKEAGYSPFAAGLYSLVHLVRCPLICWSTLLLVHSFVGPLFCWSTLLFVHSFVGPLFCWSTLLLVHLVRCPLICWSTLLLVHSFVGPLFCWSTQPRPFQHSKNAFADAFVCLLMSRIWLSLFLCVSHSFFHIIFVSPFVCLYFSLHNHSCWYCKVACVVAPAGSWFIPLICSKHGFKWTVSELTRRRGSLFDNL